MFLHKRIYLVPLFLVYYDFAFAYFGGLVVYGGNMYGYIASAHPVAKKWEQIIDAAFSALCNSAEQALLRRRELQRTAKQIYAVKSEVEKSYLHCR